VTRRALLASTACALVSACTATATTVRSSSPWEPGAGDPPQRVTPGPWQYFTPEEGATVEALVDRLIPPDDETAGGKDAGCAVFIDRQLAGPYGSSQGLYMRPPFQDGTPQQGPQSALTPAARYRQALAALASHCKAAAAGKTFVQLPDAMQDQMLTQLERGTLQLEGANGRAFFEVLLKDTQEGFFADPIYGGNRDMAAWKMIGFPGSRYDYRAWITRHNERFPLPPVSILGRAAWSDRVTQ
jgi:gluconate 2-dehydrogenase gamma chain